MRRHLGSQDDNMETYSEVTDVFLMFGVTVGGAPSKAEWGEWSTANTAE